MGRGLMNPELRSYRFELRISVFTQALEAENGSIHGPLPPHPHSEQGPAHAILQSLPSSTFGLFSFARTKALETPLEGDTRGRTRILGQ